MNGKVRKLRPEFWKDERVRQMSRAARLLFVGLWTFADDCGYLEDDSARLRLELFPGDWDTDDDEVAGWINELVRLGAVERVTDRDGKRLLYVVRLRRHQGIEHKSSRSRYAMPDAVPGGSAVRSAPTAVGAARAAAEQLPPDLPAELRETTDQVVPILVGLAAAIRAESPARGLVARAIRDYPQKDHVKVARDYEAWQVDPTTRRKQRNVVRGYRNQLDMAPDMARSSRPRGRVVSLADEKLARMV